MSKLPATVLLAALLAACLSSAEPPEAPSADPQATVSAPPSAHRPAFRGLTLDLPRAPEAALLPRLRGLGVTHAVLIPFAFQRSVSDPDLSFDPAPRWFSESARGARALAAAGDSLGVAVVLKPQVWIGGHAGGWSAEISFDTETDWQRWESGYRAYVLHHARVAAEIGSPLFVVGTELGRAVSARPGFFRALIAEVRAVFPGAVTYAANWHDDFETVPFWDALDYVGVQAYFPLAAPGDTALTVEKLTAAWQPHVEALRRVHERTGKPVLFTEIGYRSVGYAAAEPWRWPARGEASVPHPALQARLYEAFFRALWAESWFAGAFVWKWEATHPGQLFSDEGNLGFAFHDRPAERVLARWYGR